jgi:hypothetical protein
MRGRTIGIVLCASFAVMTTGATLGCRPSPITSARIEGAIAPTFAHLVQVQVSRLGLRSMSASDVAVMASCRRLVGSSSGAGGWTCTIVWHGPQRQAMRDTYDLFVATDGCYTAAVEGERLGGPVLQASDGRDVRNLLYAFEGCFDTT